MVSGNHTETDRKGKGTKGLYELPQTAFEITEGYLSCGRLTLRILGHPCPPTLAESTRTEKGAHIIPGCEK